MALVPLILLLVVMYMLLIRPQQRRVRQHQVFVASLEVGEEVVTAGGIFGRITSLDDESVLLEIAPGVSVRVLRGAVSRRVAPEGELVEDVEEPGDVIDVDEVSQIDVDDVSELDPGSPGTLDDGDRKPEDLP